MEETKETPVQDTEDADESEQNEGSDSKYRNRKFSDVSDLVDQNLSSPDFCTSRFAIVMLLILFNIYFLFFGALFVDAVRGEL